MKHIMMMKKSGWVPDLVPQVGCPAVPGLPYSAPGTGVPPCHGGD
jgi:hypothetical protein